MISLDTNAVFGLMRNDRVGLRHRYRDALASGVSVAISSIVLFELHFGIARSARRHDNTVLLDAFLAGPVTRLAFEPEDAVVAGEIRTALQTAGTPIGAYDVLIAGQALRHDAILVTANVREFRRVPGLKVENWAKG